MSGTNKELDPIKDQVASETRYNKWDNIPPFERDTIYWSTVCERFATEKAKELLPKEKKEPTNYSTDPVIVKIGEGLEFKFSKSPTTVESSEPQEKGKIIIEGVTEWTPVESQEELWRKAFEMAEEEYMKQDYSINRLYKTLQKKFSITRLTP